MTSLLFSYFYANLDSLQYHCTKRLYLIIERNRIKIISYECTFFTVNA